MRNCYIPKCDHKNRHNPKRAMFNVPIKNAELFRKWQAVLPVHNRPLKEFDRVCEQHFREEDIFRYWEHTINGIVERMERHKPALKPNAVPVFVEVDSDEFATGSAVIRSSNRKFRKKKDSKSVTNIVSQNIDIHHIEDLALEGHRDVLSSIETNPGGMHLSIKNVNDSEDHSAETKCIIEMNQMFHPDFDSLSDDVYEVVLPSTLWGIHRDLEKTFICFSEFSKDSMNVRKYLFIDRCLNYRMAVGQRIMKRGALPNGSTEIVSELLTKLDEIKIRKVVIKGSSSVLPDS